MKPSNLYESLTTDMSLADRVGFNPYYLKMVRGGQGKLKVGSAPFFDLASNDYLGLATDPRITAAMVDATTRFGSSFCGTPIAAGYADILAELESAIAGMVGLESAVIFPSCYQANCSLFCTIADGNDCIVVDHYAHASLVQGIKASGARIKPFLHNDIEHLEKQLVAAAAKSYRRTFVVTETVFSTEGSIAPFDEINRLCERYNATPVVDDSHGIGVIGKNGRGILEHKGIRGYDGIYTASLGKALANTGGVIAGKTKFINYLRYNCSGLIYSTALVPASAGGLLASIAIVINEFPALEKKMWNNHNNLVSQLTNAGFTLKGGEAPIASIMCGSSERTITLAKLFFEQGILSTPFIPPSVPPEQGVLRLIIGAKENKAAAAEIAGRITAIAGSSIR
jgi:7-keto-8-aminopelargonate synthetase-like enzyme